MADSARTMEYFFAQLFAETPEIRALFPLAMAETRTAVFDGLARLIWILDCPREFDASLRRIARAHRKYGVREKHHALFFDALVRTVELVSGAQWTTEAARAWRALVDHMTQVMQAEVAADQSHSPPWWVGEIVRHDRRSDTVAVVTIRPDRQFSYLPGQYVPVQVPRWPRIWRSYSIANAPRDNGLLDLHVRAVPGGLVSNVLVSQAGPGDAVILGPPGGAMRAPADPARALVCIAAGTGLAPLKAIIEEVAGDPWQRKRTVCLYLAARNDHDFYDMRDLLTLRSAYPCLTIIPAAPVPGPGARGGWPLMQAVRAHPGFESSDVYLGGPAAMVSDMIRLLDGRVKASALHHDPVDQLVTASGQYRREASLSC